MNCLPLTRRSKQSKSNLACLAQSVEHAAVNRSVGGPSPSTGAKQTTQTSGFFVALLFLSDGPSGYATMLRIRHCETAVGGPFMCASTLTSLHVGG